MTVTRQAYTRFRLRQAMAVLLIGSACAALSACQTVKLSGQSGSPTAGAAKPIDTPVAGNWQISYSVGAETQSAHVNLSQSQNSFQGVGSDDSSQTNFVIDSGTINGKSITFHKRYHVEENPNLPPIVYIGSFEMVKTPEYSGPYMSGTYKQTVKGQSVEGKWDAQIDGGGAVAAPTQAEQSAPPQQGGGNRRPHLSGKWDAGYEFEFKTVHSSMYIEQDGAKISGHGMDKSTKEAFTIKGTYKYPDLKMWIKYLPVKASGKNKAKGERSLEFRGTAAVVNDAEYQGTRLEGKTNGGGLWMAEQVK